MMSFNSSLLYSFQTTDPGWRHLAFSFHGVHLMSEVCMASFHFFLDSMQ